MNYLAKKSSNKLLEFGALTITILLSLIIAEQAQTVDVSSIAKILVVLFVYGAYFIFNEITVIGFLIPFTFAYLNPANYLFYLATIMFFLLFVVKRIWQKEFKLKLPYFKLFHVVLFFGIIATFKASILLEGLQNFFTVILIPMIVILVINNSDFSYKDITKYLKVMVFVAAIVGFLGIIIALKNPTDRIGSTWKTAMTINAFYIYNFFVSLGLAFREIDKKKKILFYVCSLIILFGMLFTYTRISLLSVAFGGFLLAIRFKELRKFAIIMLILIIMFIPSSMVDRAGRNIFEDPSIIIRFFAWIHTYELFLENPILGIGFDTWKNTYSSTIPFKWLYAEHPHNAFFKILLELGLIGMISYFTIIFNILWRFFKNIRNKRNYEFHYTILIATLAVLFSSLTDVFIVKIPITTFFWIMLALMIKMNNENLISKEDTQCQE